MVWFYFCCWFGLLFVVLLSKIRSQYVRYGQHWNVFIYQVGVSGLGEPYLWGKIWQKISLICPLISVFRIWDPLYFWPLDPGSGISLFQILDSTHISGMRKKLIPDPGAKKFRIRNVGQTSWRKTYVIHSTAAFFFFSSKSVFFQHGHVWRS